MINSLLNKVVFFQYETGCIPAGCRAFIFQVDEPYAWCHFDVPIFGRRDLKLHIEVIEKHGMIEQNILR